MTAVCCLATWHSFYILTDNTDNFDDGRGKEEEEKRKIGKEEEVTLMRQVKWIDLVCAMCCRL